MAGRLCPGLCSAWFSVLLVAAAVQPCMAQEENELRRKIVELQKRVEQLQQAVESLARTVESFRQQTEQLEEERRLRSAHRQQIPLEIEKGMMIDALERNERLRRATIDREMEVLPEHPLKRKLFRREAQGPPARLSK